MKKRAALYVAGVLSALLLPFSAFAAFGTYGYGIPYAYNTYFSPYSSSQYYSYMPNYYTPYYPIYGYDMYGYYMYTSHPYGWGWY